MDFQSTTIISGQYAQGCKFRFDTENHSDDGAKRIIDNSANFGLVHPSGTNLRSTDLDPGAATPMVRFSDIMIIFFRSDICTSSIALAP